MEIRDIYAKKVKEDCSWREVYASYSCSPDYEPIVKQVGKPVKTPSLVKPVTLDNFV